MTQLQNIEMKILDDKNLFATLCLDPVFEQFFTKIKFGKYSLFSYEGNILNLNRVLREFEIRYPRINIFQGDKGVMVCGYHHVIEFLNYISRSNALNISDYSKNYLREASTKLTFFYLTALSTMPAFDRAYDATISLTIMVQ